MIITCPKCSARYRYDESRFGDAPARKVKCPKCSKVFEVKNPELDQGEATYIRAKRTAEMPKNPDEQTDQVKLTESQSPELPQLAPLPADHRFSLAVIAGEQGGTVFPITTPRIYLGRGSTMDVQVQDPEVSRQHAMIEIRGDMVTLVDLGATNGTFVESQRITTTSLDNQTEFTIGSTTLMLIITSMSEGGL